MGKGVSLKTHNAAIVAPLGLVDCLETFCMPHWTPWKKSRIKKTNKCLTWIYILFCWTDVNPKQHVPLQEYADNLKSMIRYLKSVDIAEDKIILMTPPPLQESAWEKECLAKGKWGLPTYSFGVLDLYLTLPMHYGKWLNGCCWPPPAGLCSVDETAHSKQGIIILRLADTLG